MAQFTQEQLDTLNQAIAEGALIVWYGDKRVEYRSLTEMLQIKKMMEDDLAPTSQKKPTRILFYSGKSND
jgi:hypothetical protein